MTRMWMVNPEVLCRNHLLGEHKELHQLVGTLKKGYSVDGYVEKGLIDTSKIQERHEQLVEEMKSRGHNHNSPLEYEPDEYVGEVDSESNFEELYEKCEDCRERIEELKVEH